MWYSKYRLEKTKKLKGNIMEFIVGNLFLWIIIAIVAGVIAVIFQLWNMKSMLSGELITKTNSFFVKAAVTFLSAFASTIGFVLFIIAAIATIVN